MEDSSCVIDSSSSSSSSDDFEDFMMLLHVCEYDEVFLNKMPQRTSSLRGEDFVMELLNGHERTCYELFRMDKTTFLLLCANLKEKGYLKATKEVMIEEALAMFLIIVGHNVGMRVIADRFQHSLETVDRHFTLTLKAICKLAKDLISHTNSPLPSHVVNNSKYYPWFQKCIGAIDGTHISASVPMEKQVTYRGRKAVVTQNVLCACNFDMMFTFVYAGWEGTTNDSRVLLDAITRPENKFPWPKEGEYYVVDSGYSCTMGFLPPYRGERYHLQDYRGRGCQPKTYKELFNYRHSSLRNIIERCFGVLKARFPILKMMPSYKPSRQPLIVVACCTLHNFIRKWTQNDVMFRQWEEEQLEFEDKDDATTETSHTMNLSDEAAAAMAAYRDRIAQQMWNAYVNTL